ASGGTKIAASQKSCPEPADLTDLPEMPEPSSKTTVSKFYLVLPSIRKALADEK
ncbi:hypothetical protein U1Q18_041067, partial [Sarracenia purpurea var. burkii]